MAAGGANATRDSGSARGYIGAEKSVVSLLAATVKRGLSFSFADKRFMFKRQPFF